MLAYYGSHILHTAVTYFDVVHVAKGVILVLLREVFRYELKEGFADVSFHAAVKRRIIPDNVTLAEKKTSDFTETTDSPSFVTRHHQTLRKSARISARLSRQNSS